MPAGRAVDAWEATISERAKIGVDLVNVYEAPTGGSPFRTLAWGDEIEVLECEPELRVNVPKYPVQDDGSVEQKTVTAFIRPSDEHGPDEIVVPVEKAKVLKVDFVDVQQGDAAVVETPDGKVMLIDGGDNQLFARYLAARFPGTTADAPKPIDCILVSHGDADHFRGLIEIYKSEQHERASKQLFIKPARVFHNGLVKREDKGPERDQLGAIREAGEDVVIVGLEDDFRPMKDDEMNATFRAWRDALKHYGERSGGELAIRRLAKGDDAAFDFLRDEKISVEVLGPLLTKVGNQPGLKFLGNPGRNPQLSHPSVVGSRSFSGTSVSHTINGHSVVIRLGFGDWHFLFAGDLNEQASDDLTAAHERRELELRSEVLKVPHHGSADFAHGLLGAVAPLVSVVSSGDEQTQRDYIHPRATLMNALGQHARSRDSVLFVTELVAFFQAMGWAHADDEPADSQGFYAFRRAAWGLVKLRAAGNRLLVYTNSAQIRLKEAYAFRMEKGEPVADDVRKVS